MSPRALEILKRLIAFDTVSSEPNMALIEYVRELLASKGIESLIVKDETGKKANLFASTGPRDVPGVLLSGHTDVVPAAGQAWTMPPFQATLRDGRIYGRGTCDMKGFIALAIDAMLNAADMTLLRPLQLALSHDEEIGCVGVRRLLDVLHLAPVRPFLCVVGEPTLMQFAVGHKGKASYRTFCRGQEAHSSLAPGRSTRFTWPAISSPNCATARNESSSKAAATRVMTFLTAPCTSVVSMAARR